MTIQGTLTSNFRELIQMLALNQKAGTVVLETARGPRTIHIDRGGVAFVAADPVLSHGLLRVVRRRRLLPAESLERPVQIRERSGRFLGEVLSEMGLLDAPTLAAAHAEAVAECFLDLQVTEITHFQFVEGKSLCSDGSESPPVDPPTPAEALLLDLTRKVDQWAALAEVIPTLDEVYEGTGVDVSVPADDELDPTWPDRVVPCIDGLRSLDEVAEASDVDRFAVLRIAVALVQGGGIRPVPTPDLLARAGEVLERGEAVTALPMLRRTLDRPDAPREARVRLADALEALGRPDEAAAALDEFAEGASEGDPLPVFDALDRALHLRGRDLDSAARVCDHFLQHRPWLLDRRDRAVEALRVVVQAAPSAGRAIEAAERVEAFLSHKDVPDQDVLLAADLFIAGEDGTRAAAALCRRAEALLHQQRKGEARELFRRAAELDPSRTDAKIRVKEIQGEERRHAHNRRVVALLILLALLVLGSGAGIYLYQREVEQTLQATRRPAELVVGQAERESAEKVAEFVRRAEAAREVEDPGLAKAAQDMVQAVHGILGTTADELAAFSHEVNDLPTPSQREAATLVLKQLETRVENAKSKAKAAVADLQERATKDLAAGEKAYTAGSFAAARVLLRSARNLALRDDGVRGRAQQFLARVEEYIASTQEALQKVRRALDGGDAAGAFRLGVEVLATQLESDATRALRLPVRLESDPPGAQVFVGGVDAGARTPCLLEYSPFGDTTLSLRLPGRTPFTLHLPSAKDVFADAAAVRAFDPSVKATLPEGIRWRIPSDRGPFRSVWGADTVPVLLTSDGLRVIPVDAATGRASTTGQRRTTPLEGGGSFGGDAEWWFVGRRALEVRTPAGARWLMETLAPLGFPPAAREGSLVVVDDEGTVYGADVPTGTSIWRRDLGVPPAQPLFPSALGTLVSTEDGIAWAIDPRGGAPRKLAAASAGAALVLPFGSGALLLGGGKGGFRVLAEDGSVTSLGDAAPTSTVEAWAGPEGAAWIEADGVHCASANARPAAPVAVPALGKGVRWLGGAQGVLYGLDETGLLRAASMAEPDRLLWSVSVGGRPTASPVLIGDALFIVVDGGVVAVER